MLSCDFGEIGRTFDNKNTTINFDHCNGKPEASRASFSAAWSSDYPQPNWDQGADQLRRIRQNMNFDPSGAGKAKRLLVPSALQ
ncbi:MAG: hypothetical protein WBO17_12480 [Sphingorhabdus sp.]